MHQRARRTLQNCCFLVQIRTEIYLNVYLVDVVLKDTDEADERLFASDRSFTALLVGLAYVLPYLALHCADIVKVRRV